MRKKKKLTPEQLVLFHKEIDRVFACLDEGNYDGLKDYDFKGESDLMPIYNRILKDYHISMIEIDLNREEEKDG